MHSIILRWKFQILPWKIKDLRVKYTYRYTYIVHSCTFLYTRYIDSKAPLSRENQYIFLIKFITCGFKKRVAKIMEKSDKNVHPENRIDFCTLTYANLPFVGFYPSQKQFKSIFQCKSFLRLQKNTINICEYFGRNNEWKKSCQAIKGDIEHQVLAWMYFCLNKLFFHRYILISSGKLRVKDVLRSFLPFVPLRVSSTHIREPFSILIGINPIEPTCVPTFTYSSLSHISYMMFIKSFQLFCFYQT